MKKVLYLLLGLATFGPRSRLRAQSLDSDPVQVTLQFTTTAIAASVDTGGQPHLASIGCAVGGNAATTSAGQYGPFSVPTVTAQVTPGEDYQVNLGGNWLSSMTVQFTPPPGFAVEINDTRLESYAQTFSTVSGNESGSFAVRVVPLRGPPGMRAGATSSLAGGKVFWQLGLGWLTNGLSAGTLTLNDSGASGWAARNVFQPAALVFTGSPVQVPVYRDAGGALRQIYAPQSFVDIVATSASSYTISFYNPSQVQGSDFPYTPSGSPYETYALAENGSGDALEITKTTYDSSGNLVHTESDTLAYDNSTTAWAMTGWVAGGQTPLVNDNRTESLSGSGTGAVRTETASVSNATGATALQGQKTYETFAWGDELTQKVGDYNDTVVPGDANATQTYSYYTDSTQPGYGLLKSIISSGGGWKLFDYYDSSADPAIAGQIYHVYAPFGNTPTSPTADPTQGEVTTYAYVADWTGREDLPSSIITTVNGTTVAQAAISYSYSSTLFNGVSQPVMVTTRKDYSDANDWLTTVTKTFRSDATNPVLRSLPWSAQHPDGTQESYAYESGDYSGGAFTPDASGVYTRVSEIHGTTNASDGSLLSTWGSFALDPLTVVANQSTAQVSIRDARGLVVRSELDVCSGGTAFTLVNWIDYAYDAAGHRIGTTASNGAVTSASYTGDQLTAQTDATGLTTTYAYDNAGRVVTVTKKGVSGTGGYAAQSDLSTTYTYDAAGDVLSQVVGGTLTTQYQYDQGGRLIQTTAPGGYVTSYSYPNGGRDLSTTLPGGATKLVTNQFDGTPASLTGTAQVSVYYTYNVNGTGLYAQQNQGYGGSGNWTRTQTDWLGRETLAAVPDPSGNSSEVDTTYTYNSLGQLSGTSTPGMAPTLYGYTPMGALELTVLDVDGHGLGDVGNAAGTDRISQQDTSYVTDGSGNWWLQTLKSVYADGRTTPVITGTGLVRLSGFASGVEAETKSIDADGNVTDQQTVVDAASQLVTTKITTSGISTVASQVAYNGLMVSSTDQNNVTRTYGYDGLDRPVRTTDPRTGDIDTSYESASSQVLQTAYGDGTPIKQFTYGTDGRVASVTDANGDVTSTAYNKMGQVLAVSGSGAIPVTYTYDPIFGRLATEMTTGQAGSGTTTFGYDGDLPLLATRTDDQGEAVTTAYDALGRVSLRTDARGLKTAYAYDPETGDLLSRAYSDGTPTITYTYNRTGALATVADAAGTRTFAYNTSTDLSLKSETLPALYAESGGAGRVLSYTYDPGNVIGRLIGVSLGDAGNASADQTTNYAYDAASGRLSSVTGNGAGQTNYAFNYTYVTNSDLLVASVANPASGFTQNYSYEPNRDWLSQATTVYGTTVQSQFGYQYTSLGQRASATQSGAAFAAYGSNPVVYTYGYDSVGQLTTALGAIASTPMSGRQYQYAYDQAGNRASANHTTQPALAESYTLNTLNQISTKGNTTVAVQGSANATGVLVTVNGVTTAAGQTGGYWGTDMSLANAAGPATGTVSILAGLSGGSGSAGWVSGKSVSAYLPPFSEAMTWDKDGNLLTDGTWDYTWNAENQLISMVNTPAQAAGVTAETIQFSYDYLGRRITKTVNGTVRHYVYNGWNIMAELDASGNVLRHFIWGLDLSGTMDGAGGVGGLLMIQDSGSTYFPGYGANGNVVTLTTAATGALAATYEYSPFGELLQASGSYAASNPFRFSTKWWDAETGYAYYGYRYYSPRLGRFLNQDPIQEKGGINLYGFCGNDPIGHWDLLGNMGFIQGFRPALSSGLGSVPIGLKHILGNFGQSMSDFLGIPVGSPGNAVSNSIDAPPVVGFDSSIGADAYNAQQDAINASIASAQTYGNLPDFSSGTLNVPTSLSDLSGTPPDTVTSSDSFGGTTSSPGSDLNMQDDQPNYSDTGSYGSPTSFSNPAGTLGTATVAMISPYAFSSGLGGMNGVPIIAATNLEDPEWNEGLGGLGGGESGGGLELGGLLGGGTTPEAPRSGLEPGQGGLSSGEPAAENVAANVAPRALTAADLGAEGTLTTLDGTYSVANGTATAQINMIQGTVSPFKVIPSLMDTAAADGATTLQIQGTVANERLYNILVQRYGMTSQGAIDTITIPLK